MIELLISYLLGSIPNAYIIIKLVSGKNIMKEGSGNVGATNSYYVSKSIITSIIIGLLDVLKGYAAAIIMKGSLIGGVLVVLGHNYSIWLGLRGGKGIAATIGYLLYKNPLSALLYITIILVYRAIIKKTGLISYEIIEVITRQELLVIIFNYVMKDLVMMVLLLHSLTLLKYITNKEWSKRFNDNPV